MIHLATVFLILCALAAGLAMARLVTNWYADR
jgi:hypothetical protein